MRATTGDLKRTGEPGHRWDNQAKRLWPPKALLDPGERQRMIPGPVACVSCGDLWPGTAPCGGTRR